MRPDDLEVPIARQQFPLGVIAGSLALVLRTGTRLQRVAEVLAMHWNWCGLAVTAASYYSVRLWLMRLGLYQLSRPKVQADDWIWIIDHTMQLGERKCLIVVGLRQSSWNVQDRVLDHEDVELIELVHRIERQGRIPTAAGGSRQDGRSTGDRQRRRQRSACGHRAVLPGPSRHGLALRHQAQDGLSVEACPGAGRLVADVPDAGPSLQAAGVAHAPGRSGPPQQRSKARYMNVDVLVDWAQESLLALEHPQALRQAGLKVRTVEEKLGWLRKFAPPLRRWGEMLAVIGAAEHYVRHEGHHAASAGELAAVLPKSAIPPVQRLRALLEFIAVEGRQAREGERLLGSSEVLESIIGRFKHVAGERGQHGLTGMVLSIGALVGNLAVETVHAAMTEITTTAVWDWCQSHLGATVQSVRQRIRQALHPEQNRKTPRLETG